MTDSIPVVLVKVNGRHCSYYDHLGLKPGDKVVVPFGENFLVGVVIGTPETTQQADKATKWVVQSIMDEETMDKWNALTALRPPPEPKTLRYEWYVSEFLKKYIETKELPPATGKTVKFRRPV